MNALRWNAGQRVRWCGRTGTIDKVSPEAIHHRIALDAPWTDSAGVTWTHRYAYGPEMELLDASDRVIWSWRLGPSTRPLTEGKKQ